MACLRINDIIGTAALYAPADAINSSAIPSFKPGIEFAPADLVAQFGDYEA